MANAEILATTLGTENTYGTVAGRTPAGPFSYARITTDDRNGVIRAYAGTVNLLMIRWIRLAAAPLSRCRVSRSS